VSHLQMRLHLRMYERIHNTSEIGKGDISAANMPQQQWEALLTLMECGLGVSYKRRPLLHTSPLHPHWAFRTTCWG
jgi:hypothetical protein